MIPWSVGLLPSREGSLCTRICSHDRCCTACTMRRPQSEGQCAASKVKAALSLAL